MKHLNVLLLVFFLGTPGSVANAVPRDELLRLVPDDMMLCVVLQDLREHAKVLDKNDSFLSALRQMPFAQAQMASPDFKKLHNFYQTILKELSITPDQLRDDLLGDSVVFAFRQGKQDPDQALLLVWARDAKLLATVLDRVNEIQKKSGDLKELRPSKHGKRDYIERVKLKDGQPTESEYYFIQGNLLAFSQRETLLKDAINRADAAPPMATDSPFWSKMSQNLGLDKRLISLLLNPRVFDNEFASREKAAAGSEKTFLAKFRDYWKAFDGVGAFADVGADLELGIAISARAKDLPPAGQRVLAELGKPSALWGAIPEDCLLGIGARIDCALLVEMLCGFLEPDRVKEVRKWLETTMQPFLPDNGSLDDFLKGLGPDWGFWVVPPDGNAKSWVPQAILAVHVPGTLEGAVAETAARNAIQFLFTAAQISKEDFKVETVKIKNTTIKCLSHPTLFPPGFRPSFAVKEGFLLLSSSPGIIGRFQTPKELVATSNGTPVLRVSAKAWRAFLTEHKAGISTFIEKASGTPAKEIAAVLDQVASNLEPFDRLEIAILGDKERATLMLRVKTASGKQRAKGE